MPSKWAQKRAELTVDNAECAAQVEVNGTELRESFVRNIAAALDEAGESILARLRNPDDAMVEAVAAKSKFNRLICREAIRVLADVLDATPPEATEE